jgi:hypothetical protein
MTDAMERFWLASRLRDDAKWLALSAKEKVAVIEAMCWTADHEEDGFVPSAVLSGHGPRLIETGWMVEVPGGCLFPKWKQHQISRSKLKAKRRAAKERMQRARSVRANEPRTSREVRPTEERRVEESRGEKDQTSSRDRGPEATRLCTVLADLVEANGSKRPQITQRWLDEADRLVRLDKRPVEEVESLLRWSQDDSFWRANVLSMVKFRAQYDTLRLQRERVNGNGNGNGHDPSLDITSAAEVLGED